MNTPESQPKNPLHGITLEKMLTELVEDIGWEAMGQRIKVRCFTQDPSIQSSLTFLRKTPWAREKVESMYLYLLRRRAREAKALSLAGASDTPPQEIPGDAEGSASKRDPGPVGSPLEL